MRPPTRDVLARMAQSDPRAIRFLEELAAGGDIVWPVDITASGTLPASAFDGSTVTRINSAGAVVLTIAPGLRLTQMATVARMGTGAVTFAPGAGVTLLSESGFLSIAARYALAMVRPLPIADQYLISGRLA